MLRYPVQRQRFPDSSFRISSRVGVGLSSSRQRMVMRKPGAQKAHWNAWFSNIACWIGWSSLVLGEGLDRLHVSAVRLDRQHQARTRRPAVDADGARATDTVLASQVGAGQAQVLAEHVGQRAAGFNLEILVPPVDPDGDPVEVGHDAAATRV